MILPALILVVFMNLFVLIKPAPEIDRHISCEGIVRHVEYNLDNTVEYEIRTSDYGRLLYKSSSGDDLEAGDLIYIEGSVIVYRDPTNPGEFDYAAYLRRRGITGSLFPDSITKIGNPTLTAKISSRIQKFFFRVKCFALSCFDDEDRSMAAALFTGDTSLVDDSMSRRFRLSNCSHLLAVSGTHFSGFLMILTEVIRKRHVKKKRAAPIYIVFCLAVGTLTGWSESVTRAAVISVCSFMSRDYASGMAFAAIILMVKDPYCCLSTGFLMSFSASLSIRVFGNRITELLSKTGTGENVTEVVTPVFAATIGMMPFWGRTCCYLSPVHLVIQIVSSLIATAACVFFLPCVITGLPFACSFLFKLLNLLTGLGASIAFEGVSSGNLSTLFIDSAFAVLVIALMPQGIVRRYLLLPCVCVLMLSIGLMAGDYLTRPAVTIVFIDVGQGDSCLILSEGRSLLIDGGVEDEGRYAVSGVLDYYGIGSVDIAVASHMDEDHIGGLNYLNSVERIDEFITCYDISAGDEICLTDDIALYCLWPYEVVDGGNDDSVVLRLEYHDFSVLYTGDLGFRGEDELIRLGADIDSDILKVGHHGSAYSTSSEFLEHVTPDTAIISVEQNSRYGHPAPATVERLTLYGCEIRRTDLEGAIIYELQ